MGLWLASEGFLGSLGNQLYLRNGHGFPIDFRSPAVDPDLQEPRSLLDLWQDLCGSATAGGENSRRRLCAWKHRIFWIQRELQDGKSYVWFVANCHDWCFQISFHSCTCSNSRNCRFFWERERIETTFFILFAVGLTIKVNNGKCVKGDAYKDGFGLRLLFSSVALPKELWSFAKCMTSKFEVTETANNQCFLSEVTLRRPAMKWTQELLPQRAVYRWSAPCQEFLVVYDTGSGNMFLPDRWSGGGAGVACSARCSGCLKCFEFEGWNMLANICKDRFETKSVLVLKSLLVHKCN